MGDWQPIESAPFADAMLRSVQTCLVYSKQTGVQLGRAWRYEDGTAVGQANGFSGGWGITHWMPLPEPPK